MAAPNKIIQGSLFEDDYLVKSLGNIVRDAEYALTELVANAWDAGATKVNIVVPTQLGGLIRVTDNGVGMTLDEFKHLVGSGGPQHNLVMGESSNARH